VGAAGREGVGPRILTSPRVPLGPSCHSGAQWLDTCLPPHTVPIRARARGPQPASFFFFFQCFVSFPLFICLIFFNVFTFIYVLYIVWATSPSFCPPPSVCFLSPLATISVETQWVPRNPWNL
jgi:hypothetical protein